MISFVGAILTVVSAVSLADLPPVPGGGVRVYLVRHGQAFSNLTPLPDLPPDQLDRLTPLGHEQARKAGVALKDRGIAWIVTSPKGRASETADEIAAVLGIPVRVDPRLRSLEIGKGEDGKSLKWDQRLAVWKAGRDPEPKAGESLQQLGNRVLEAIASARQDLAGKSVVFVSHGEVMQNLVGILQGKPPAQRFDSSFANGSISVLDAGAEPLTAVRILNFVPPSQNVSDGGLHAGAAGSPAYRPDAP